MICSEEAHVYEGVYAFSLWAQRCAFKKFTKVGIDNTGQNICVTYIAIYRLVHK